MARPHLGGAGFASSPAPGPSFTPSLNERRRHGDPFPLRAADFQKFTGHMSSPDYLQRGHWIIGALNTLALHDFCPNSTKTTSLPATGPTAVQVLAFERIASALNDAGPCPADLHPDGCLRDMLGNQCLYDETPRNLAAYDATKVKVMSATLSPRPLRTLLPPHARILLDNFTTYIEKAPSVVEAELRSPDAVPMPTPYWDPCLRHDRGKRRHFIAALARAGLIGFRRRLKARVGVFFVKKKSPDFIRMVIDARVPNRLHHKPPVTRLASGSCYIDLDLSAEGFDLGGFGGADVVDDDAEVPPEFHEATASPFLPCGQEADVNDCFY